MPRCPTLPAAIEPRQPPTPASHDANHVLRAPAPNESGIYPIGVFSDAETTLSGDEVDDVLRGFADAAARLRGRYVQR